MCQICAIDERGIPFPAISLTLSIISLIIAVNMHCTVQSHPVMSEYKAFAKLFKVSPVFVNMVTNPPSIQDMLTAIHEHGINHAYRHLAVMYVILGTIAVSSASAERSFSRLKLIKSYLRSTMSQERLSSLALISIESDLASNIDFDTVIDTFSRMSNRRIELH